MKCNEFNKGDTVRYQLLNSSRTAEVLEVGVWDFIDEIKVNLKWLDGPSKGKTEYIGTAFLTVIEKAINMDYNFYYPAECFDLAEPVEQKLTPHVHADVMKAYADGYTIQCLQITGNWYDIPVPQFDPRCNYRVKPKELVVTYKYRGIDKTGFVSEFIYSSVSELKEKTFRTPVKALKSTLHDGLMVDTEIISL